jgi:hypothetical protein
MIMGRVGESESASAARLRNEGAEARPAIATPDDFKKNLLVTAMIVSS